MISQQRGHHQEECILLRILYIGFFWLLPLPAVRVALCLGGQQQLRIVPTGGHPFIT
jgi:hypothetical protein